MQVDPTSNPDGTMKLDENGNPIVDGPPSVITVIMLILLTFSSL